MYIETYKSGHSEKGLNYSYFVPELINRQWEWKDPQLGTMRKGINKPGRA